MSEFVNFLLCPRQRRRHVQAELERLTPGVIYMGRLDTSQLDLSRLEWAERREGVLVRWRRSILDASMPRILSGRLNCAVLLAYVCDGAVWGYVLCYKGSLTDQFRSLPSYLPDGFTDSVPPDKHAARLAQYFPADRQALQALLTPWTQAGDCWQLEDFLRALAPWTGGLPRADRLEPGRAAVVPDTSSPRGNGADPGVSPRPEEEPGLERCLPFLTAVRVLRRGWSPPLSPLYALFPKKRPGPETVPHQGWTVREVERALARFLSGELDRLELDFTVAGEGVRVRRLGKTVYQTVPLTLALIREKGRCMCLFFDGQDSSLCRLIANRTDYMETDVKQLRRTRFLGREVEEYVVFSRPDPPALRQEVLFLLARLDRREEVLSAARRMGVWSCESPMTNTQTARQQYQELKKLWCMG